jgi:purine-binding chemotaxis protein CheW
LEERPVQPSDRFVIARTPRRTVALAVDDAEGVVERAQSSVAGILDIAPGSSQIRGVLPLEDGLVLVHDLEKLLSKDDEGALEAAMGKEAAGGA